MKIDGPESYQIVFDAKTFCVDPDLSERARSGMPKLYVVSSQGTPIYVGMTKQKMRQRLRYGWEAMGKSGYYGYAWRRELTEAHLDIWYQTDSSQGNPTLDMETIEAEVVFLIRTSGQWPVFQTEIHFHPSSEEHRTIARRIHGYYDRGCSGKGN